MEHSNTSIDLSARGAGAPSWGFPGMTYIDTTNNRWYVNVGGTWRYVGLT